MTKFVNVTASVTLSTEFIIEVPEDATEEKVKELAEKQIVLPNDYPNAVTKILKETGIQISGLDSMFKSWNVDDIAYIYDEID